MRKSLKLLAILFVLTTASGCSLTPPNQEICANLATGAGYCAYTLDGRERVVIAPEWQLEVIKPGRISMSPEAFGEYQAFVQMACEKTNCSSEQKAEQKKALEKMAQIVEAQNALNLGFY